MSNYYDNVLAQLLATGAFDTGSLHQGALARGMASESEDEMLRGRLGSRRKRREGEPPGSFALANYPGLMNAVNWAATGNLPGGSATIGQWMAEQQDPQLAARGRQKRMDWAKRQRELLGLGGSAQDLLRRRR